MFTISDDLTIERELPSLKHGEMNLTKRKLLIPYQMIRYRFRLQDLWM